MPPRRINASFQAMSISFLNSIIAHPTRLAMFGYRHALLAQGAEGMLRGDPKAASWRGCLSLGAALEPFGIVWSEDVSGGDRGAVGAGGMSTS